MSMQLLPIKNQMVEVGGERTPPALDLFFMPLIFRFREEVCSTSPPTNFHHIVKNTPPPKKISLGLPTTTPCKHNSSAIFAPIQF